MSEQLPQLGSDVFYSIHGSKGGITFYAARVHDPVKFLDRVRKEYYDERAIIEEINKEEFDALDRKRARVEDRRP